MRIVNQIERDNFCLNDLLTKSNRTEIQTYKVQERTFGKPCILLEHRRPKLCGSSLDFEFIRKCINLNKIRPTFHFLTKIEIKMTYWLVFLFCFLLSLRLQSHLKAVLSTFKILSCTNSKKLFYDAKTMFKSWFKSKL